MWIKMVTDYKKMSQEIISKSGLRSKSCLRIGPRNDVVCATIASSIGHSIPWTSEIRYLGVYLVKFRTVKCSLDAAKRGFFLPGS